MPLADLVDLGTLAGGEGKLVGFLDQICDRFGFDYAAYAGTNPVRNGVHGYVNYPEAWKQHYAEQGFHRLDPTLLMASRSLRCARDKSRAYDPSAEPSGAIRASRLLR